MSDSHCVFENIFSLSILCIAWKTIGNSEYHPLMHILIFSATHNFMYEACMICKSTACCTFAYHISCIKTFILHAYECTSCKFISLVCFWRVHIVSMHFILLHRATCECSPSKIREFRACELTIFNIALWSSTAARTALFKTTAFEILEAQVR